MKIISGGKDLGQLIERAVWSGDAKQVARKLEFTLAKNTKDPNFPNVTLSEGDEVILQDDAGKNLFGGILIDIDKNAGSNTVSYLAYDLMFYVNNSELTKDFSGTPEAIAAEVCAALGITPGNFAQTGISINNPCVQKTGYVVIQSSYTAAARQNGKKYMPMITELNRLSVIEKGVDCGVQMTAEANISEASYKMSLQNMVNKVLITDKKGKVVGTAEDTESQQKYGTVQKIIKEEKGKDAKAEAKAMLKNGEASASVSGFPDDPRAVSGYSLLIEEPETGLLGKFYISGDTHTYENGKAVMALTLEFENLMDEQEPGKKEEKKKDKKEKT